MLYDRHADAVLRLAEQILGDATRAEDVLQDVFVTVARHAACWRGGREPSARGWLLAIAGNRARDLRRAERRQRRREAAVARSEVEHEVQPTWVLEDDLAARLGGLPAELRLAVELRLRDGLAFTQVAAVLGVSLRTAKSRVGEALERLRRRESGR